MSGTWVVGPRPNAFSHFYVVPEGPAWLAPVTVAVTSSICFLTNAWVRLQGWQFAKWWYYDILLLFFGACQFCVGSRVDSTVHWSICLSWRRMDRMGWTRNGSCGFLTAGSWWAETFVRTWFFYFFNLSDRPIFTFPKLYLLPVILYQSYHTKRWRKFQR